MKMTGNEPAYPTMDNNGLNRFSGLTIRQQFAMVAMNGMLAHSTRYRPRQGASNNWHEAMAEEAVQLADALIAELNKSEENQ